MLTVNDYERVLYKQIERALKLYTNLPERDRDSIAAITASACMLDVWDMEEEEQQREQQERLIADADTARRKLERANTR